MNTATGVTTEPHTAADVLADLRRATEAAGGVVAWARAAGVSHTAVSLTLSGHRAVPESLANACGYIVETRYRRIGKVA